MAGYDASKAAAKQISRVTNSVTDYQDGVKSTQKNPMQLAKKAKKKMLNNFQKSMTDGTYEAGLDSVSIDDWKQKTADVGGARLASGIEAAAPKIEQFHQEFANFMQGHMAKIDSMDDSTPEARIQKMVENARGIAKFKRSRLRR